MENCWYQGRQLCTFDLKDDNHYYISELVEEWKIAADQGKLICSDCGQSVYLAAGPIREPYFAHYDRLACPYGGLVESEESKKGKRLLYSLLKRSFPENEIYARYKLDNGMYSTCYADNQKGRSIAIDYRLNHSSIEKFLERDRYYQSHDILPLYVLGINQNKNQPQVSWYENMIQKSTGLCLYLDAGHETLLLKKCFDYRIGRQRMVRFSQKYYRMEEVLIGGDGVFLCDFEKECSKVEQEIQDQKQSYREKIRRQNSDRNEAALLPDGIRADILRNAIACLRRGEAHLVSQKYMDYIREHNLK